jgi:hypothetical protein
VIRNSFIEGLNLLGCLLYANPGRAYFIFENVAVRYGLAGGPCTPLPGRAYFIFENVAA